MVNRNKTFILGLGHQKCGTTWLYSYLSQFNYFCRGMMKEYHVWDALDIPLLQRNRVNTNQKNSEIQSIRFAMQNNPNFYFDYFSSLYTNNILITADISPSYCGLKAERLQLIQNEFKKRGIKVKAIIFIRDPLARIKSAVRFNLDRKNFFEGVERGLDYCEALDQYYHSPHCIIRTSYQSIITEAKEVFGDENLFIGVYENLFTNIEVIRLSDFLGTDLNLSYSNIRINKTLGVAPVTILDQKIRAYYSDVYKFCYKNFPITQDLWAKI